MTQMYRMSITASGVVRDADGNVVSEEPLEALVDLTEKQFRELTQGEAE